MRPEQTNEFGRDALRRFEDRAVRHMRRHLPGPTERHTDGELRRRVGECIPRSTEYGLSSEQQVMCFVDTTFLLNDRFDSDSDYSWAAEILRSGKLSPAEKGRVLLYIAAHVHNDGAASEGTTYE
jgi:hypothetical protein